MKGPCAVVAPGLYVGGIAALDKLQDLGITHVVSVVNDAASLQHPQLSSCQHHPVDVSDSEDANLLSLLPGAVGFIASALGSSSCGSGGAGGSRGGSCSGSGDGGGNSGSGGSSRQRVLVHCAQGMSRSTAVAAAYLMSAAATQQQQQQGGSDQAGPAPLDPDGALALLRRACPAAAPNPGFVAQLELFYAMGCRLEESYIPFKRFLLQQAANHYHETGCLPEAASLPQPAEAPAGGATLYRCRKCRCLVATSHNVVETEQGPGASAFRWRKRDKQQRQALDDGSGSSSSGAGAGDEGSLFVEPLRWMGEAGSGGGAADSAVGGAVQGKLYCPKCHARLGSFNWAGTQSSSGAWVTPAFQLHLAKLDSMDSRPPAALAAIRQPRMLGTGSSSGGGPAPSSPPTAAAAGVAGGAAGAAEAAAAADGAAGAAAAADEAAAAGVVAHLQSTTLADAPVPPPAAAAPAAGSRPHPPQDGAQVAGSASSDTDGSSTMRFQHLVLDCDGVLVDSERASCEALRQAVLQVTGFDIPHDFPQDFQPVFGMDVTNCVVYYQKRFAKWEWGDAAQVAAKVSDVKEGIYQRLTADGIAPFAGVAELVGQARSLGMAVAVASSGSPEKIAHNLGSSGLAHLFPDPHLVVSAKHVARGKPAPDVYLEALRRLGCTDASRALVVEDAVNGLHAAKAAGCFAVAVATSLPPHMLEAHADLALTHLRDLDLGALQRPHTEHAGGDSSGSPDGGE